jgi:porin
MELLRGSRCLSGTVVTALALGGMVSSASAQSTSAQSADGSRPGDLFSLNQIGQAAGQMLQNYGIYLKSGYVNDILGNVKGGNVPGVTATGDAYAGVDFDMETIAGIPNAAIHFMMDDRTGKQAATLAGTNFGLSGENGPSDTVRLSEFSWDQSLFDDHLRVLVGRVNPTADFATFDLACAFLSNITCAQPFAWYVNDSGPAYPVSTWGGRITVKPSLSSYLRVGVYQDDPSQGDVTEHGFDWGINRSTGVFIPFEVGYQTGFFSTRYPFHYDIGGFYDTGSYTVPAAGAGHSDLNRRGRTAFYAQLEQTVWHPDPATDRSLTVFGGVLAATGGYQQYPVSVYAGVFLRRPFTSRPNDSVGLEGTYVAINKSAEAQVAANFEASGLAPPDQPNEWIFEANYSFAVAPGVSIAPVAQYVIHPDQIGFNNPSPGVHGAFLIGAQVVIDLNEMLGLPRFIRVH